MKTHPTIAEGNMKLSFPGRYRKHVSSSMPELNSRYLGVKRIPLVLLLLLFVPTATMSQRYGPTLRFGCDPSIASPSECPEKEPLL